MEHTLMTGKLKLIAAWLVGRDIRHGGFTALPCAEASGIKKIFFMIMKHEDGHHAMKPS